ncbi:MAG: PD-(D/E)XK nuclease family protein [Dysosmobacter sp.]
MWSRSCTTSGTATPGSATFSPGCAGRPMPSSTRWPGSCAIRISCPWPLNSPSATGETLPAVVISEPDGELRLGGKVDRVDGWVRDGKLYLRVVDYKSGRKAFDLSAVKMGLDIQMLLYLFTLQKEGQAYFHRPVEPAGVLYLPARDEILTAERSVTPEELTRRREKELRRSGLVLAEPEVLQAMEHESLTEPHYLPVRVGRDGSPLRQRCLGGSAGAAGELSGPAAPGDRPGGPGGQHRRRSLLPQRGRQLLSVLRLGRGLPFPGRPGRRPSALHSAGKGGGILEVFGGGVLIWQA